MPLLVREYEREVPYQSWNHYKNAKRWGGATKEEEEVLATKPCARCWGQGRIFKIEGKGYEPYYCGDCLGTGFALVI